MDYERLLIPHLTDPDAMRVITEGGITQELFSTEVGEIFQYSSDYYTDAAKLKDAIPRAELESHFTQYFTVEGWPEDGTEFTVAFLVEKIREQYRRSQIQSIIKSSAYEVMDDPNKALTSLLTELSALQIASGTSERITLYGEGIDQRLEDYQRLVLDKEHGVTRGIPLGWKEVTEETGGIYPGELAVVVGYAGTGKSYCLAKMALEAAEHGHRVYLASFENDKHLTVKRLDCLVSGVSYRAYERGQLTLDETRRLKEAKERIRSLDNLIIDTPRYMHERTSREVYSRAQYHGAEIVVGDQLSWVYNAKRVKDDSVYLKMSDTIQTISDLTRSFGVASVWAAQFNREHKGAKSGSLAHIGLSSNIEQVADWAFYLSNSEVSEDERMVFGIMKARRSRPMKWILNWSLAEETRLEVEREFDFVPAP